jgi:hypothetical protein
VRLEVLDAWLAALRSGEFAKGRGRLVRLYDDDYDDDAEYCCLGVLCELARRDRVPLEVEDVHPEHACVARSFDGNHSYLPVAVQRWAGLSESNPRLDPDRGDAYTLAALNDASTTFEPVIEVLERWRAREVGT